MRSVAVAGLGLLTAFAQPGSSWSASGQEPLPSPATLAVTERVLESWGVSREALGASWAYLLGRLGEHELDAVAGEVAWCWRDASGITRICFRLLIRAGRPFQTSSLVESRLVDGEWRHALVVEGELQDAGLPRVLDALMRCEELGLEDGDLPWIVSCRAGPCFARARVTRCFGKSHLRARRRTLEIDLDTLKVVSDCQDRVDVDVVAIVAGDECGQKACGMMVFYRAPDSPTGWVVDLHGRRYDAAGIPPDFDHEGLAVRSFVVLGSDGTTARVVRLEGLD